MNPGKPSPCFPRQRVSVMDHTRQYFDQVADKWDDMRKKFFGDGVRQAAIQAADVRRASWWPTSEPARGSSPKQRSMQARPSSASTNPTECSPECRSGFAARPFEPRRGETDGLPLKDGEVDAVLANMVLHHAPDPAAAIEAMSRALKPGGRSSSPTPTRIRTNGCEPNSTIAGSGSTAARC